MNILYASDENYLRHAAASIVSLCEHTPPEAELRFHLLSMGVSSQGAQRLRDTLAPYGRELCLWELGDLRKWFDFSVNSRGFALSTLARLFVGRVLPEDVHRVLYLDCDTLPLEDLSALEQFDLKGCPVAMAQEPTARHSRKRELGLAPEQPYFNAGVLLIDLDRWRAEGTEKTVLDYYREKGGALLAPDQDALNGALAGHICPLPPRYNFGSVQIYYPWKAQKRMSAPAPFYPTEQAYQQAAFPPAIIHFLGEERPWREGNRHPYRAAYEAALAKTPWRGAPMESGWQTYFRCFDLFNRLTRPFPLLRWRIINALIPAFMRYREQARKKKQHG